jgi:hypothetical protein
MRSLLRNKRQIHYALRTGEVANIDEYGNETGELTPVYGAATPFLCNISAASGEDAAKAFGNFTGYVRTMYVAENDCPIDERTIIWFGVEPTEPHNYIVVRKADSKNGILYALQEVTVV